MGDAKSLYSEASKYNIEVNMTQNAADATRYSRSKDRERAYGTYWKKHMVNLNDIVDRFAPGVTGLRKGYKFIFQGSRYTVIADMPSGYLRVYDEVLKSFVTLDGVPSRIGELTHFKILKRGDVAMYITLILKPSLIRHCYGPVPDISNAPVDAYELYQLTINPFDYFDIIDTELVVPIDELCGALLDVGDVDYLNARQCELLIPWLIDRLKRPCPYPLDKLFPKLLEYAQRAAELGTGVVVEL